MQIPQVMCPGRSPRGPDAETGCRGSACPGTLPEQEAEPSLLREPPAFCREGRDYRGPQGKAACRAGGWRPSGAWQGQAPLARKRHRAARFTATRSLRMLPSQMHPLFLLHILVFSQEDAF